MDRLEGVESTEDRRSDEDIIWARLIQIIKSRELWVNIWVGGIYKDLDFTIKMIIIYKVGRVVPMAIPSEFRVEQH